MEAIFVLISEKIRHKKRLHQAEMVLANENERSRIVGIHNICDMLKKKGKRKVI